MYPGPDWAEQAHPPTDGSMETPPRGHARGQVKNDKKELPVNTET